MRSAGIACTAIEVISRELRLTWLCALGLAHVATAKLPELFAPSMNAKLAFTAISQSAAAISCCREAATKALERVPRAFFSRCHHSRVCPSGG